MIINDILDYSKIEARKIELEILDFDPKRVTENVADVLSLKAQEKGLEFNYLIHNDVPQLVRGDPGRLRQILTNLADNAIKFTEQGEVVIRATLEGEDHKHATIRFSVSDTGIGIPQDQIGRLFKSFSQVDASTTRRHGGTGLGLAISKKLAELMGGQIGVDSEEGKGSVFWFTAVLAKQDGGGRSEVNLLPHLHGKRILVVDDNATNRQVLREQLSSWECCVEEASSGAQALEKLRQALIEGDPFIIAMIDMQMPKTDGLTLGTKIKQDPNLKDTKLVMMTSMGHSGKAKHLMEIGFSGCLNKPVRESHLYDCLRRLLSSRRELCDINPMPIVTRHPVVDQGKCKLRILIAEDDITNQKVAIRVLEKLGYRVDAVANGKEAIKALEMIAYDLVLMDVQMPEMDGLMATKIIRDTRSEVQDHNIPVIAMTAMAMKGDREKCLEAGMDGYVTKPIQPQELRKAIEGHAESSCQGLKSSCKSKANENEIFERAALLDRLDGDEEFCNELIRICLRDVPGRIESIKKALEENKAELVQKQAHNIKGASANIGAKALSEVAFELELAGKNHELKTAPSMIEQLERELDRFQAIYQGF
jgi:CheY-like chemotaxis protein/HPt (histidine-containing phosphotransfer) domain-containing protein